jgi:hypothetical protein
MYGQEPSEKRIGVFGCGVACLRDNSCKAELEGCRYLDCVLVAEHAVWNFKSLLGSKFEHNSFEILSNRLSIADLRACFVTCSFLE